ncbi:hypothetical protein HK104_010947 [Borealophlyctis nickersoniae]|nr:hypothetical protein HK104_010947 [Borealophlyctis nickersoniae]
MAQPDNAELDRWADEVLALCGSSHPREHVMADLRKTRSAEATINRIFDGQARSTTQVYYYWQNRLRLYRTPYHQPLLPLLCRLPSPTSYPHSLRSLQHGAFKGTLRDHPAHSGVQQTLQGNNRSDLASDSDTELLDLSGDVVRTKEEFTYTESVQLSASNEGDQRTSRLPRLGSDIMLSSQTSDVQSVVSIGTSQTDSMYDRGDSLGEEWDDSSDDDDILGITHSTASVGGSKEKSKRVFSEKGNASKKDQSISLLSSDDDEAAVNTKVKTDGKTGVAPSKLKRTSSVLSSDLAYDEPSSSQLSTGKRRSSGDLEDGQDGPKKKRRTKKTPEEIAAAALAKEEAKREKEEAKREKEKERERQKLLKQMEKEAKQEERKRQKEEKEKQKRLEAEEKKALRDANKIRMKEDCTSEMIVDMSQDFVAANGGPVITALQASGAKVQVVSLPSPISLRWRRRVTRVWDETKDCWVACCERIEEENHVLVRLEGEQLARLCTQPGGLVRHLATILGAVGKEKRVIYFIEGLDGYFKKVKKKMSAQFMAQARTLYDGGGGKTRGGCVVIDAPERHVVEEELLKLQLEGGGKVSIHHSKTGEEPASWIASFTKQIAMIPELKHRSEEAWQLKFGDSVKSGSTYTDTWSKMLQELSLLTENKAAAIIERYPTLRSLYEAYKRCPSEEQAQKLLANIQINNGTSVNPRLRNLGPVLSKRVYESMMVTDPKHSLTGGE